MGASPPFAMFRRPPRNFRGRRRAASSGSSDEEPQPDAALPPAPNPGAGSGCGSGSGSEREAEPEEGEGCPGSAAASPERARAAAAAAKGPLSPEEPAGSPGKESGRAVAGRGPRLAGAAAGAGTGPARGGKVLLSFGSEEEREGKCSAAFPPRGGPAERHLPRGAGGTLTARRPGEWAPGARGEQPGWEHERRGLGHANLMRFSRAKCEVLHVG